MIIAIPINILENSNVVDHLNPSITDVELKIVEKIKIKYAVLSVTDISVSYTHLTLPTNREV